jgi:hypothetical protein
MESHDYTFNMQKRLVREIESNQPKFIVVVNIGPDWLKFSITKSILMDWSANYLKENYELAGLAYVFSRKKTIYKWGEKAAKKYLPFLKVLPRNSHMLVYKRKI